MNWRAILALCMKYPMPVNTHLEYGCNTINLVCIIQHTAYNIFAYLTHHFPHHFSHFLSVRINSLLTFWSGIFWPTAFRPTVFTRTSRGERLVPLSLHPHVCTFIEHTWWYGWKGNKQIGPEIELLRLGEFAWRPSLPEHTMVQTS